MPGTLYLIPSPLGGDQADEVIPGYIRPCIARLDTFIVERVRTARRYIRRLLPNKDIDSVTFLEWGKHTDSGHLQTMLQPLMDGQDVGLLSEAGLPAVADPGAGIIARAHELGIRVMPLSGPSSLMLALMASGMSGQQFTFLGYLPAKSQQLPAAIRQLEQESRRHHRTQLFIEAPYRNDALLEALLATLSATTRLGVAVDLTLPTEQVIVRSVADWHQSARPALHKRPTVFMVYAGAKRR